MIPVARNKSNWTENDQHFAIANRMDVMTDPSEFSSQSPPSSSQASILIGMITNFNTSPTAFSLVTSSMSPYIPASSSSSSSPLSPELSPSALLPSSSSSPSSPSSQQFFSSSTSSILSSIISSSSSTMKNVLPELTSQLPLDSEDQLLLEEERCVNLVPQVYEPVTSSICALLIVLGLVYLLFGYRLFKTVLFLTGFMFASAIVYCICLQESLIPMYGNLLIAASGGLLFGLITLLVGSIGMFILGFNVGLLLGTMIILSIHLVSPHVETLSPPESIWITFAMICGWGLIGSFSGLYFQKGFTILGTCLFGSVFVILSLDYFVENFNLFLWFWENLKNDGSLGSPGPKTLAGNPVNLIDATPGKNLCLISWILMMLWSILVILGLFCQWYATGRGYYHHGGHSHASSSRRNGQLDLVKIRQEESKTEQKQRKYRYLYQVRTAHGDVISQHYIQNLQKKVSPHLDQDSLRTYNSDLSHLTAYNQSESRTTTMSHLP